MGDQIHRAVVVSAESAVLMVARFSIPFGAPLSTAVPDPGCPSSTGFLGASVEPLNLAPQASDAPFAGILAQQVEPFTYRSTLEPFRIHQLPDFMIHSRERSDIVFQRSVFAPGPGGWHIHSGPSFVYVLDGQIKLQKFTEQEGCFETAVYGPGQAYFEEGEQVHGAVVVSESSAVLLVVRFNIPVGGPISIPVPNPSCIP